MKHLVSYLALTTLLLAEAFQLNAAESVWDCKTIATGFYSGTGSKSNPYTIYTASQFAYFYKEMSNGRTFEGQYISLKNDIDMTNIYLKDVNEIGDGAISFKGHLNGEDHTLAAQRGYYDMLMGEVYGTVYNVVFAKYPIYIANINSGAVLYNCKLEKTRMGAIYVREDGTVANCYCNDYERWQNGSKYGGAYGLCNGPGNCVNCHFTGMTYISYGGSTADNYGSYGYSAVRESNGVSDTEHNQWVSANSTSTKTYKSWPLTFSPTYPSYTVTISFVDESGFTNYSAIQRTAGTTYTLPAPTGFESTLLGWEVNGKTVKSFIPTDQTVCTAQWKHEFAKSPTLLSPTATPQDKSRVTTQWYRMETKKENLANTVTTVEAMVDDAVLEFDYSVYSSSGGYSSSGYSGYISVDGTSIVYCSSGNSASGHYKTTLTKGTHTISRSAGSTTNVTLSCPSTPVGDANIYQLDLSAITPANGVYYCEATYGTNKVQTDTLDTADLFYAADMLYAPTAADEVALLRESTTASASLIPVTVINNDVEYTITGISDYAFSGCSSLQKIICMQSEPLAISTSAVSSMFKNVNKSTCRLLVPTNSVTKYKAATGWKDFVTIKSSTVKPAKIYLGNSTAITKNTDLDEILEQDVTNNGLVFIDDQDVDETLPANFITKNTANQWVASGIALTDAQPLYSPAELQTESISYSRTFANMNWQAWYVPFDMPYADIADKAQAAYINNVHQYDDNDDGIIDRTILEFISVKSGVIEGNTPYVIKPLTTGDITFETEDAVLLATEDKDVECQSTRTRYVITGNYLTKKDMYSTGAYALSQGSWKKTSVSSTTLQPFRISMVIISKNASQPTNAPMRIQMTVDGEADDDVTGLVDLYVQDEESGETFNLNGQKVAAPTHGIYIKNGKKFMQR